MDIFEALNRVSSLEEFERVYLSDHHKLRSTVQIEVANNELVVIGQFIDRASGSTAGHFKRRLTLTAHYRFVVHRDYIGVDDAYIGQGVAWCHYLKAIRYYYVKLNAAYVTMSATYDGPYAWGDFGFEFTATDFKLLLARLHDIFQTVYGQSPPFDPSTATELKHLRGPDGFEVGIEAIMAVQAAKPELTMILHFGHGPTIQFLKDEGILRP